MLEAKSRTKLSENYGLDKHYFNTSMKYYQIMHPEWDWKGRKKRVYGASKYGNKHGAKPPSILVPEAELLKHRGKSVEYIARELGVSPFFVRRAMQVHSLDTGMFPTRMVDADADTLKKLEFASPGISEAIKSYYEDPNEFFSHVNEALDELYNLVWFLNDFRSSYRYFRDSKGIITEKGIVSWQSNKHERIIGQALRGMKIPHTPQFPMGKYMWDFKVGDSLLVEIDGEYHKIDKNTQKRDKAKEKMAKDQGYQVIRFTIYEVDTDLDAILIKISDLVPPQ